MKKVIAENFLAFCLLAGISLGYFLMVEIYIPNEIKLSINIIGIPVVLGCISAIVLRGSLRQKLLVASFLPILWTLFLHQTGDDPYIALGWLVTVAWILMVCLGVLAGYGTAKITAKFFRKDSSHSHSCF